jgi:hypothetical protein
MPSIRLPFKRYAGYILPVSRTASTACNTSRACFQQNGITAGDSARKNARALRNSANAGNAVLPQAFRSLPQAGGNLLKGALTLPHSIPNTNGRCQYFYARAKAN